MMHNFTKPRWTQHEINLLTKHYSYRGGHETQRILARHGYHRTYKAIGMKARKLLLYRDNLKGNLIPLTWVAPVTTGSVFYNYVKRARQANALTEIPGKPRYWITPTFANELETEIGQPVDTLGPHQKTVLQLVEDRGRVTTKDAAEALDMPVHRVARPLKTLVDRGRLKRYRRKGNTLSVWTLS